MSDWDADDFEVDVKQIDEKKIKELPDEKPVEVTKTKVQEVVNNKSSGKDAFKSFAGDIDRELTESEKIMMQKKSDLSLARELFGEKEEKLLNSISSLPDFKSFGEDLGTKLSKRIDNVHYTDMLLAFLRTATHSMDASKLRILSFQLKALADEKSVKEKEEKEKKPKNTKKGSNKPSLKGVQKSTFKLEDYGADGYDDIYDLEDDFI